MRPPKHQQPVQADTSALPAIPSFVTLAADQLGAALAEATVSFGDLTGQVLTLARHANAAPEADQAAQDALVRLQAVDRLQQRLGNVDRNLRALAALMESSGLQPSHAEWRAFLKVVRGGYTTETERTEFDALGTGALPS